MAVAATCTSRPVKLPSAMRFFFWTPARAPLERSPLCRDPGPGPVSYTKETLKKRLRHNALLEFGNVILCLSPVSRRGYFFHRPVIDELLSPVIGEALRFRSPLAACSASISSCLRSASRLALAAESFAAAALSAHLLASCRRCSERVLILQVADYFAATALPVGRSGRSQSAHSDNSRMPSRLQLFAVTGVLRCTAAAI